MNIERVRKELIEWETNSVNKENMVLYEARLKELRDLLSNLEGERRLGREEGFRIAEQEGFRIAEQEGFRIAEQEGQMEARREMTLKMLEVGIEQSLILELTGLSEEELRRLSKENGLDY